MYTFPAARRGAEEDAGQRGAEGELHLPLMLNRFRRNPGFLAAHRIPCRSTDPPSRSPSDPRRSLAPAAFGAGDAGDGQSSPGGWQRCVLLATGGHGTVYLAAHTGTGRRAALKVLARAFASSPEMSSRFMREARILSRLRHPNVVDILELGLLPDGRPFVAMELLEGRSLLDLVFARGRFSLPEALELLAPVCDALCAAHREGVIHRDVKASNVFVEAGDPPKVKLLDFGVAHAAGPDDPSITVTGERIGSVHAMAPELIRGDAVDARADVYALGVLLYQLLTGELPFWSEDPVRARAAAPHRAAAAPGPARAGAGRGGRGGRARPGQATRGPVQLGERLPRGPPRRVGPRRPRRGADGARRRSARLPDAPGRARRGRRRWPWW